MSKADPTMTHRGSGRYSDVFEIKSGLQSVIAKLSYYRDNTLCDFVEKLKKGDRAGARTVKNRDSIMVGAAFADMTNALIATRASPHFVFVYCHADCRMMAPRLKTILGNRIKTSTKIQLKYNNLCLQETFTTDFTTWLRARSKDVTDANVRSALFGVLYTLAVLQKRFPSFRHNDLSTNNILIKKSPKSLKIGYIFDGTSYFVTVPFLVAISDYDFTHVPNHPTLQNERVIHGKYRVTQTKNRTYDTHFFLKSIMRSLAFKKNSHLQALRAFLKSLPLESTDRLDTKEIPGLEPSVLLRHSYFNAIRKPIPSGVETYSVG